MVRRYRGLHDLPATLAVFPLPAALLLPRGRLPLNVFEPRYLTMVDAAMGGTRLIGMVQPLPGLEQAERPPLCEVGCVGRITSYAETDDGRYLITLTGLARFRVGSERDATTPYRQIAADFAPYAGDLVIADADPTVDRTRLAAALKAFIKARNLKADLGSIEEAPAEPLINTLAMICPFPPAEKQALLEAPDLAARAKLLLAFLELPNLPGVAGSKGQLH